MKNELLADKYHPSVLSFKAVILSDGLFLLLFVFTFLVLQRHFINSTEVVTKKDKVYVNMCEHILCNIFYIHFLTVYIKKKLFSSCFIFTLKIYL